MRNFKNDLLETVIKGTYITAISALPPASGIAFSADDDDVLPFDDRQHLRVLVGRDVIAHHSSRVEQFLPWACQNCVQSKYQGNENGK